MRGTGDKMNKREVCRTGIWVASLVGIVLGISAPSIAAPSMSSAERLHRLDVMLRVSSARCSSDAGELRVDYVQFVRNHRFALDEARHELRAQLIQRDGVLGADSAYERMNYELADEYRRHHPWLSCEELKVAARGLAVVDGSATLIEAADQILPESSARQVAANRRD